jgi:hypothetical protein
VRNVAAFNVLPLTSQNNFPAQREGHPELSIGGMEIRLVAPGYFAAMGIPVLRPIFQQPRYQRRVTGDSGE